MFLMGFKSSWDSWVYMFREQPAVQSFWTKLGCEGDLSHVHPLCFAN